MPKFSTRRKFISNGAQFAGLALGLGVTRSLGAGEELPEIAGQARPLLGVVAGRYFERFANGATSLDEPIRLLQNYHAAGGRLIFSRAYEPQAYAGLAAVFAAAGNADSYMHAVSLWPRNREGLEAMVEDAFNKLSVGKLPLLAVRGMINLEQTLLELRQLKNDGRIEHSALEIQTAHEAETLMPQLQNLPLDFVILPHSIRSQERFMGFIAMARLSGIRVLSSDLFEGRSVLFKLRGKALPHWAGAQGLGSWQELLLAYYRNREEIWAGCIADVHLSQYPQWLQAVDAVELSESQMVDIHRAVVA